MNNIYANFKISCRKLAVRGILVLAATLLLASTGLGQPHHAPKIVTGVNLTVEIEFNPDVVSEIIAGDPYPYTERIIRQNPGRAVQGTHMFGDDALSAPDADDGFDYNLAPHLHNGRYPSGHLGDVVTFVVTLDNSAFFHEGSGTFTPTDPEDNFPTLAATDGPATFEFAADGKSVKITHTVGKYDGVEGETEFNPPSGEAYYPIPILDFEIQLKTKPTLAGNVSTATDLTLTHEHLGSADGGQIRYLAIYPSLPGNSSRPTDLKAVKSVAGDSDLVSQSNPDGRTYYYTSTLSDDTGDASDRNVKLSVKKKGGFFIFFNGEAEIPYVEDNLVDKGGTEQLVSLEEGIHEITAVRYTAWGVAGVPPTKFNGNSLPTEPIFVVVDSTSPTIESTGTLAITDNNTFNPTFELDFNHNQTFEETLQVLFSGSPSPVDPCNFLSATDTSTGLLFVGSGDPSPQTFSLNGFPGDYTGCKPVLVDYAGNESTEVVTLGDFTIVDLPSGLQSLDTEALLGATWLTWAYPDFESGSTLPFFEYQIKLDAATDWPDAYTVFGDTSESSFAEVVGYTFPATTLNATIYGLAHADYQIRIRAADDRGAGKASMISVSPTGAPQAPTGLTAKTTTLSATAGKVNVVLAWTALTGIDQGDSAITGYKYERKADDETVFTVLDITGSDDTTATHTVEDLEADKSYSFRIFAVNGSGDGKKSEVAISVAGGVPQAPQDLTAALVLPADPLPTDRLITGNDPATTGDVVLSWTPIPVGDNGGSAVTAYWYQFDKSGLPYDENRSANNIASELTSRDAHDRAVDQNGPDCLLPGLGRKRGGTRCPLGVGSSGAYGQTSWRLEPPDIRAQ